MKNGLLLGAGFSYDLGMPLTIELTEVFLNLFTYEMVERLGSAASRLQPYGKDRPINRNAIMAGLASVLDYKNKGGKNYEAFLGELQNRAGFSSPTQSERDSYNYLFDYFYQVIHLALCLYQEVSYGIMYSRNRQWFSALKTFLTDAETWVFSLNHDLYLEYLALDFNIPITYGDDHTLELPVSNLDLGKRIQFSYTERKGWSADHRGFLKGVPGFNLVKLHGGLSEFSYKDDTLLCNLQLDKRSSLDLARDFGLSRQMAYSENGEPVLDGQDRGISDINGNFDIISNSMLTGGRKYSGTSKVKDGEEKLQILDAVLSELDEITVIGYGFGDEHINFRLSNAMLLNEKLRIVVVDPYRRETPSCLRQFDYDSRIRRASSGAAQWMEYRKTGIWDQVQMKALQENQQNRADIRKIVKAHLKLA
jgi:hypothetical protein